MRHDSHSRCLRRASAALLLAVLTACTDDDGDIKTADPCVVDAPGQDLDFAQTLSEWEGRCPDDAGTERRPASIGEGRCGDGKRALMMTVGLGATFRYFDDDGSFVAGRSQSDAIDMQCLGMDFWPRRVSCERGTVTRVVCGPALRVGQALE